MVLELISWKHSFKRLNEENKMAKKKKEALDNLLTAGRISQPTYDLVNSEINEAVEEIEKQRKALLGKMNSKMQELEAQIKTLEMLFANFEIQHVTGELNEEIYQREIDVLSMGIDAARQELETVRDVLNQLSGGTEVSTPKVVEQQKMEPQPEETEISESKVEVVEEKLPELPAERSEVKESDSFQVQQENSQETSQNKEVPQSESIAENEEKQEK
jgi:hypothetical protein